MSKSAIVIFQYKAFTPEIITKLLSDLPNDVNISGFSGASGFHSDLAELKATLVSAGGPGVAEKTFIRKVRNVLRRKYRALRKKLTQRLKRLAQRKALDGKMLMWNRLSGQQTLVNNLLSADALVALDNHSVYSVWRLAKLSDQPATLNGLPALQLWLSKRS